MNLKLATECLKVIYKANTREDSKYYITPRLRGHTGIGKTEVVKQLAKDLNMRCVVVHLGQISDAGDLLGLIDVVSHNLTLEDGTTIEKKATAYIPPNWLPHDGKTVFLLDEFNHTLPDLRNALFEFLLSGKLGTYQMPQGSFICLAENPATGDYASVKFYQNKAESARICTFDIDPDMNTWSEFAYSSSEFEGSVVDFFNKEKEHLVYFQATEDSSKKLEDFDSDDDKILTFRTAAMISQVLRVEPEEHILKEILKGFGGVTFANSFMEHHKNAIQVHFTDILKDYSKVKQLVKEMTEKNMSPRIAKIVKDVVEDIKGNPNKDYTKKEAQNLREFLFDIDKDIAYNFVKNLEHCPKSNGEHFYPLRKGRVEDGEKTHVFHEIFQNKEFHAYLASAGTAQLKKSGATV